MDHNFFFKDKSIAISGGLGSIGSHIIRHLLDKDVKSITVIDNRETELAYRIINCNDTKIHFIFTDIRDSSKLVEIFEDIDLVFHAAAMKHVNVCELNPSEAIKTNVLGTMNVIEACIKNNVDKMLLISTDKAVNPTNVMGATKLLAERLVSATCYNRKNKNTKFGVVRFGNVSYSRGSVLEIWDNQIRAGNKLTITDPRMTRFFMDVNQAINLIFNAIKFSEDGETFILKMPSVRIGDLLKVYLDINRLPSDYYEIIGRKPGEKIHEDLIYFEEADHILENDSLILRPPLYYLSNLDKYLNKGFIKSTKKNYSSNNEEILLNHEQIKEILIQLKQVNGDTPNFCIE